MCKCVHTFILSISIFTNVSHIAPLEYPFNKQYFFLFLITFHQIRKFPSNFRSIRIYDSSKFLLSTLNNLVTECEIPENRNFKSVSRKNILKTILFRSSLFLWKLTFETRKYSIYLHRIALLLSIDYR